MAKAKETILAIYEEKKRKTTTVSIEVKKSQHKYVIGPRGGTLQEILALTGKEMFEECFGIFLLWWGGGMGAGEGRVGTGGGNPGVIGGGRREDGKRDSQIGGNQVKWKILQ